MNMTAAPVPAEADTDAFRRAMRSLAGGVSVITAGLGDDRSGLTATSVSSLSVEPPQMLVCVNRSASAWPLLHRYRHFGVNVLGRRHRAVAETFSGKGGIRGADRYNGAEWTTLVTGAPILADALVAFDCAIEELIDRHTHSIVIGRVCAVHAGAADDDALLYWHGGYGAAVREPYPGR